MNIFDFIESECKKYKDLNDKEKASALLNSINQRINVNKSNFLNPKTDVITMLKPLNQEEFYLKELLKWYIENKTFSLATIMEGERSAALFENIKEHLRKYFKEQ